MIVLDTNIIRGTKLGGPEHELLRALRASRAESVGVPKVVLDEVLAQRVIAYQRAHAASVAAAEELNARTPWKKVDGPDEYDPERVREHWHRQYAQMAQVLETSAEVHEEALYREANLIAPCKPVGEGKKTYKTGARDAVIWLTAVDYARQHPAESVYFVSNNTHDFGKQIGEIPQLATDIDGMENRFFLYTSLGDVLAKFGREVETTEAEVRVLLMRPQSLRAVGRRAQLEGLQTRVDALRFRTIPSDPSTTRNLGKEMLVALAEVSGVRAFEFDGGRWFTATARWLLADRLSPSEYKAAYALMSWTTRVMVAPAHRNVTVLKSYGIEKADAEDQKYFPELDGTWLDPVSNLAPGVRVFVDMIKMLGDQLQGAGILPRTPPEEED